LGDNYYEDDFEDTFKQFAQPIFDRDISPTAEISHIFLKEVHDPERFGVATLDPQNKVTKIV
jgi:dTDP-glucose pyrophosphorylase